MSAINEVRKALLNPSPEGIKRRKEVAETASFINKCSFLAMTGMGAVTLISLIATQTYPKIGGFFALVGAAGTVAAHDIMALSNNTEQMAKGNGALDNVVRRAAAALSSHQFTKKLMQDTWVVEPLFSDTIEKGLQD